MFTDFADDYQIRAIQGGLIERWPHKIKSRGGWPAAWSGDGRYLVLTQNDPATLNDIWLLSMSGERQPSVYLASRFGENTPAVAPDSRRIAYVSDESGSNEIYVNTFPIPGNSVRISTRGGTDPAWRDDGKELYYIGPDQQLMAVSVQINALDVTATAPRALFKLPRIDTVLTYRNQYAVLNNGRTFLVNAVSDEQPNRNLTVVMNWPTLLKK